MTHRTTHTRRPGLAATAAAVVLLFATAAGCSDNPDGGGKPAPTTVPTTSDTSGGNGDSGGAPTVLPTGDSSEWAAGLEELPDEDAVAACQQPNSPSCGELVRQVGDGLDTLAGDVEAAGGAGTYPKTARELESAAEARRAYEDGGCATGGGGLSEADCMTHALAVATGVAKVEMFLMAETAGD